MTRKTTSDMPVCRLQLQQKDCKPRSIMKESLLLQCRELHCYCGGRAGPPWHFQGYGSGDAADRVQRRLPVSHQGMRPLHLHDFLHAPCLTCNSCNRYHTSACNQTAFRHALRPSSHMSCQARSTARTNGSRWYIIPSCLLCH